VTAEGRILLFFKEHDLTSREETADKWRELGVEIGPRQVSRYLKTLTGKELLLREAKRCVPIDQIGQQPQQDGL
jgi:hypothetical protein